VNEPDVQLFTGASEDWALVGACPGIDTSCRSHLLVSDDRGQTWTDRAQPVVGVTPRVERVGSSAWLTGAEISTSNDGQLWFSADDGRHWSPRRLPTVCATFGTPIVQAVSSQDLWLVCPGEPSAGQQAKSVSRSADGGQHWRTVAASRGGTSPAVGDIGGTAYVAQVVALSDSRAWMTSDRGSVSVSDDGGATWQSGPDLPPAESFFDDAQFIDTVHGWIAVLAPPYEALALLRTNDGGRSWQRSAFVVP
jgi:photosystem II stability/assembly factor-like uncharacterized protein